MNRLKRIGLWIIERLKDLLYDPTNSKLDIGRVVGLAAAISMIGGELWNMHLNQPINLAELGGGLSATLTAAVAYLIFDRRRMTINESQP